MSEWQPTEEQIEAACRAFLAACGDPAAEWWHYRREVTAALVAAHEDVPTAAPVGNVAALLQRRARTWNGEPVGAGDGDTYIPGSYGRNEALLDIEAADHLASLSAEVERLNAECEASMLVIAEERARAEEAEAECDNLKHDIARYVEIASEHATEVERLRADLSAALGYMLNAKIDLDTGAPKKTAAATLEGGIKRVRAALKETDQ